MRIFVGYGYNDLDRWVEELVFPIIEAFDVEVVSGQEGHGQIISEVVRNQIYNCDALIAFTTRREQLEDGRWTTHRWVTDEWATALNQGLPLVEVRAIGVADQGGLVRDRQRIDYTESSRDKCLVELVKVIGTWKRREHSVMLQLSPQEFVSEVRPFIRRPSFRCTYILLEGSRESEEHDMRVIPIKGGLFTQVKGIPREALIQIRIHTQQGSWTSDFESIDNVRIRLYKES